MHKNRSITVYLVRNHAEHPRLLESDATNRIKVGLAVDWVAKRWMSNPVTFSITNLVMSAVA